MCSHDRRLSAFGILVIIAMLMVAAAGAFAAGCTSATKSTSTSGAAVLPAAQPADFGFVASYVNPHATAERLYS